MNRLREKLHMPKAHSLNEVKSLETMVRDSFYLAWPMASLSEEHREKRKLLRKADAIDEEDEDDG
jgi:hypothetical protein